MDLSSTGAMTITPGGALTIGATNKTFTLKGDSSSTIQAYNGPNSTSLAFATPSAAVTYSFGNDTPATSTFRPYGIAKDSSNNIYVTVPSQNIIQKYSSSGTLLLSFGSAGSGNGQFNTPTGIAVDSSGNI